MANFFTREVFEKYISLLLKWQRKINLVGEASLPELWRRHFEDSLCLYEFLSGANGAGARSNNRGAAGECGSGGGCSGAGGNDCGAAIRGGNEAGGGGDGKILDIGSGAGFPGMVLAIAGIKNISLVEADGRKCAFLDEVRRAYGADVEILNLRAEDIKAGDISVITGRAFAPLEKFLHLCRGIISDSTAMYLLKGESVKTEIEVARKKWSFDSKSIPKPGGFVLEMKNIKPI
jgi:16S rRNA (guanine527-N7)-methyltransferase